MKKIYLLLFAAVLCAAACDRKLDTWSGQDVAYIDASEDSTVVSFVYMDTDVESYNVNIYVRFMGEVPSVERTVRVVAEGGNAVAGTDFEPLAESYAIGPEMTYCVVPITLLRNESLKNEEKVLVIELRENEHFKLLYPEDKPTSNSDKIYSKTRYRIIFSEMMNEPPRTWREYQFGLFTPEKFAVMCEVLEVPREKFNDPTYMTMGRINFAASYMKQYFEEMAAAGTPVLEKDGTPMKMGDNI